MRTVFICCQFCFKKRKKPVTKTPQKRDPKLKPLQGNAGIKNGTSTTKGFQTETIQKAKDTRHTTCTRCMGFGGMDGGCPKCGGTGFSD